MPEADDQTPARQQPASDGDATPDSVLGPADPAEQLQTELLPRQGLSWSWELDTEALMTALTEPAPWKRPLRPVVLPAPATQAAQTSPASPDDQDSPADATPPSDADSDSPSASTASAPADAASAAPETTEESDVDPVEAEFAEILAAIDEGRSRIVPLPTVAGRIAESLPTGPDLAGWLATGSVDDLEDGALAGVAASYRRLASWAQAGELAAVAQLASRSAAADDKIGIDEQGRPARLPEEACAQVSLGLTMSQASASWWSDLAVTLTWRLPATFAALRAGQIDLARARLIVDATAALDEETARAVEAKLLPTAGDKTTAQLRAALRRAVIAADPKGAEKRRKEAERRARVNLYPDDDGTASLSGYNLSSIRAAAAMARITALAKAMQASGAGGGIDALRAYVFLGLLLGTLPYIPPAADGPPDSTPPDEPPDDRPDEPASGPSAEKPARPRPGDPSADGPPASNGRRSPRPPGTDRPGGQPGAGRPPDHQGAGDPDPPGAGRPPDHRDTDERDLAGMGRPPDPPEPESSDPDPPPDEALWLIDDPPEEDDPDLGISSKPLPALPEVPAQVPPGPAAMENLRPAEGGQLDLWAPWTTLIGDSGEPGRLSRIGPITAEQARYLADVAACDANVQWRVIVTDQLGRAVAVSRVPRVVSDRVGADGQASLVKRVTVTISPERLSSAVSKALPPIMRRTLRAAVKAAEKARLQAVVDTEAGGCAHTQASPRYQPPPRLREFVTARDVTCRFPTCRQPVWRCDLDHSVPFDKGGKTCSCNLGGLCRFHHQIKQLFGWELVQPTPGTFAWVTPSGRTYYIEPDSHAA
jgi:hypothetical protein